MGGPERAIKQRVIGVCVESARVSEGVVPRH